MYGIFGDFSSKPTLPVNYEIHFSPLTSPIDFVIETEKAAITTASINHKLGRFDFSFSIDNLLDKKSQPPSFEIIHQNRSSEIPPLDYKPGSPKFLQLSTIINF